MVEELTELNSGGHSGSVYAFAVVNGTLLSASSDTTVKVNFSTRKIVNMTSGLEINYFKVRYY